MKLVSDSVTRAFGRKVLQMKKNSPHIFFVGGVAGMIGTTVLASKATLSLSEHLDDLNYDINQVKTIDESENYDEQQRMKDLGYVYGKHTVRIAKLYAPAVGLGVISVAALTGSHVQLTRRNTALAAALGATMKAFDEYRERMIEELGADREKDIYLNLQEIENDEKEIIKVSDPTKYSPYYRIFDETNPEWVKDPEQNRLFVQCQQTWMNHMLQSRGHVFLNDVYDALGFERSRAGAVVGWIYDPNGEGEGDNFIDFGMMELRSARFINGLERSIVLDFNVDGIIYDKI